MKTELEPTVQLEDKAGFFFQMSNPEPWDQIMTWTNKTRTGTLKGRNLPQVDKALVPTQSARLEPLRLLRRRCRSSWRCSKATTWVVTNPRLQRTEGCCTQAPPTAARPAPPSRAASSRWSPRRGTSDEPWTSRSPSPSPCLWGCRRWSAPTAPPAGATPKRKRRRWSRAERPRQSRTSVTERQTVCLKWNRRRRRERRGRARRRAALQRHQKVNTGLYVFVFLYNNVGKKYFTVAWLTLHYFELTFHLLADIFYASTFWAKPLPIYFIYF